MNSDSMTKKKRVISRMNLSETLLPGWVFEDMDRVDGNSVLTGMF
jgi:hypothetical protein